MSLYEIWQSFGATNIIAVTAVIAALLAPTISARLVERAQRSAQARQTQLAIFSALMENRHAPQSREALRALNLIEVAFHDNPEIRRLWREYHGMISNEAFFRSPVGIQLTQQKMSQLQSAMAKHLHYGIDQFDIERVYSPRWLVEEEEVRQRERDARLALLRNASPPQVSPAPTQLTPVDGYYSAKFEGVPGGAGAAMVLFQTGKIMGADVTGARYEGTYSLEGDRIKGSVTLLARAGTQLVTGQTIAEDISINIAIDFPLDFAGKVQTVFVAEQPVQILFTRV